MSDYLGSLAARFLDQSVSVRPEPVSIFQPPNADWPLPDLGLREESEVETPGLRTTPGPHGPLAAPANPVGPSQFEPPVRVLEARRLPFAAVTVEDVDLPRVAALRGQPVPTGPERPVVGLGVPAAPAISEPGNDEPGIPGIAVASAVTGSSAVNRVPNDIPPRHQPVDAIQVPSHQRRSLAVPAAPKPDAEPIEASDAQELLRRGAPTVGGRLPVGSARSSEAPPTENPPRPLRTPMDEATNSVFGTSGQGVDRERVDGERVLVERVVGERVERGGEPAEASPWEPGRDPIAGTLRAVSPWSPPAPVRAKPELVADTPVARRIAVSPASGPDRPARSHELEPPPVVEISIDEIDVRLAPPARPAVITRREATARPPMSLEDYLERRSRRGRHE